MNIFDNIVSRFGYVSQKEFNNKISEAVKRELEKVHGWLGDTADAQQWIMPDPQVFANQADLYRLSPILGTALDVLAGDLGTSEFNVKRMVGEEERDIPNHEFELRLRNPNPLDSGIELMQYTASNYKLNGNSVWWLNKAGQYATVDEIWTIPFSMIQPVPDKQMYISHYEYHPGNGKKPLRFETWEIVHFKTYNPNNRFIGLSPIESLAVTIQGDLAMRKTNTVNYAEYGGAPQSILAFKDFVPNDAWNDIKDEKRQAAKRNEMMMLRGVGDGVSWMQRALSSKDMDYVAGLKQNMTDVFNRMCPGLLAMLSENATEANAMAARATYSEKTLWVMMEVIAQKITSDILPYYGRKLKGEFNDPRVVDRKIKLEEQAAFERSHVLQEVRKEFYGDEPLGDERDNELIANLKSAPEPKTEPQNTQPPEEIVIENNEGDEVSLKAIEDLIKWRRMALKGKAKAQQFESNLIPSSIMRSVKQKLSVSTDKNVIASIFDGAIEQMKPKPKIDTMAILRSIELGVKALELKQHDR